MIGAWMLYLAVVSTALALAARLAEAGLRARHLPGRWAWLGALLATPLVPLVATGCPSSRGSCRGPDLVVMWSSRRTS